MSKLLLGVLIFLPLVASAKLKEGQKFPSFDLDKLTASGKLSSSELKGKVVVVDFWASWCEPCKKELPALNGLYKKYKGKGLVVVGLNVDDTKDTAKDFIKEHKVEFPLAYDAGKKLAEQCGLSTMPSSYVLDRKGNVKKVHLGFREDDLKKFEAEIKSLL